MLQVICSWCKKPLGEKPGEGLSGVSHSICEPCAEIHFPDVYIQFMEAKSEMS